MFFLSNIKWSTYFNDRYKLNAHNMSIPKPLCYIRDYCKGCPGRCTGAMVRLRSPSQEPSRAMSRDFQKSRTQTLHTRVYPILGQPMIDAYSLTCGIVRDFCNSEQNERSFCSRQAEVPFQAILYELMPLDRKKILLARLRWMW